ncbi:MAG: glycoside hydrolase family 32 protein [Chitinophagaceae bacterium]|nr:MAG: glycoside hydrolase family 32 protein [Chitinophagaceae bacterium]
MRIRILSVCIFFSLTLAAQNSFYKEKFRPQFHFTPAIHWANDPNGLVYYDGEYHLFYQFNPFGNVWGHMSWGHAVSKDLLHWQHLPLAIPEENGVMIFSGGCAVDKNNSSGFAEKPGQVPMVAIYTGHIEGANQSQHLAYSLDNGRTWKKYNKNPVLDLGLKDFRDPQVFWYELQKKWVMTVAVPLEKKVRFYNSSNLKEWKLVNSFGPAGDTTGIWECPDLFEVPVKDEPGKTKWVLMLSPAPYMQYFVGDFDGAVFKSETISAKIYRPDYGPDYYAAIVYKNLPSGSSPISIGWVNNWNYANDIPTTPWKSAMSLPRKLSIKKINNEWLLIQEPVDAVRTLRSSLLAQVKNSIIEKSNSLPVKTQQCEMEISFEPAKEAICGVRLATGNGHEVEIGYNNLSKTMYIDRSKTANRSFNKFFDSLSRYETNLLLKNNQLRLHIYFDKSIIEVFADDGEVVMTLQLFPDDADTSVEIFSDKGRSRIKDMKLWKLESVW